MITEPIAITLRVIQELDKLNVPYLIGGSLASALYGEPRATIDADVVADLHIEHAAPLVRALSGEFYIAQDAVLDAIRTQRSFNVIHLATGFKVDIFVRKKRAFDDSQFARRTRQIVATDPERSAYIASAEDTILAKLEWYKIGGSVSERQWRDILGILKTQSGTLDQTYLRHMAIQLGVTDLLARAIKEAE
jgi:hypothetical protein